MNRGRIKSLRDHGGVRLRAAMRRLRRSEDGQALVELALVLPLFLLILLAIFDFGKAVNFWNKEQDLANVGARLAAVIGTTGTAPVCSDGTTPTTLTAYVQCQAKSYNSSLQSANVCVQDLATGSSSSVPSGDPLQVTVSYNYNLLGFVGGKLNISAPIKISGSATVRVENNATGQAWLTNSSPPSSC
ncbi:MAG: hypothetical protein QOD66_592 [Solirubrobacteraceae bacterium]|nr:hypothetical protein [Solirubrobacteraceae bacterium]